MIRQIIFDTETTGLSPKEGHRVIEIGCVELINRKVTGNNFHYYLNPERAIDEDSIKIHGLTEHFLANKPTFRKVANDFLNFITGAELIAHNANFDVEFLNYEFSLIAEELGRLVKIRDIAKVTDTLALAKKLHPGQRNSLDALCKRYSVDNTERNLHGALLDSMLLAKVYLAMTGGQSSFEFANSGSTIDNPHNLEIATSNYEINPHIKNIKSKIIAANQQELAAHTDFLKLIASKSEQGCLWYELERE